MSDLYNPSSVPYGIPTTQIASDPTPGTWAVKKPDGSALATIVVEGTLQMTREGIVIQRPGIFGQGDDVAVPADPADSTQPAEVFNTASLTYQVPTAATVRPYAGCYIDGTFDAGRGPERWVFMGETSAYPNNNYWTCTSNLVRDHSVTPS